MPTPRHQRSSLLVFDFETNTRGARRRFENGALVENTHTFGQSMFFFHLFQVVANRVFVP